MRALTRAEVREIDRLTIEEYGLQFVNLATALTGAVHVVDIGAPAAVLARFGLPGEST